MAIIKCKMCGGDLIITEGSSVCECEYCGTRQTVPNVDNEKKMTLFTRASRLLRNCEFDKASGVFETIVADFPEEAEAYWGLVLCKYGIEYVDDPGTGKKVPTCHRSSFDSVLDDQNFEQACENADAIARRVYRDEARQIEELRKGIIEVSGKEDPYDIFISYKETDENGERTLDSVIAQDIYNELTEKGYRVFFSRISLESKLGTEYEPYIFAALNSAKVMLVVGTDYDNFDAVWVKNEWSRFLKLIASGQKKTLIPVFKNMDACDMPKEFAKLSAQDMGKVGAMQDLLRGVEKLIPIKKQENATVAKTVIQSEGSMKTDAAIKRGKLALEDGEWEKAKQYFDQALTLDAECAEAYFGIALAELRARDPESYIRTATSQIPKTERLSIPENSAHIQKATEENAVTSFLKESEIKELYRYDLVYTSTLKGQQEIQNQVRQQIENNRSLSRALRFAAGDEKTWMEDFKKSLYDRLRANVDSARKQEEENRNRTKQNYESFLEETDRKVHEKNRAARAEQNRVYQKGIDLQNRAKTESDYRAVIAAFGPVTGFQDTDIRINQCEKAIIDIQNAEHLERENAEKAAVVKRKRTTAILSILAILSIATYFVVTRVVIPKMHYANSNNLKIVGNVVIFGAYEQDNNTSNGKESIEWRVLANEGNRSLLISCYALDCQQYNTTYDPVTWEISSIRSWLDKEFISKAFSADEENSILSVSIDNSNNQGNRNWNTNGGNTTKDRLFLLSYSDAEKYFASDSDRQCKPTAYAKAQGLLTNRDGNCVWWLRSPGIGQKSAADVLSNGALEGSDFVNYESNSVRPAFWIDLNSEYFK